MFCSVVGAFFGAYGIVPNFHKVWLMNQPHHEEESSQGWYQWYLYGFVFLRIIMMGGDTFCSIERCCALLFPLKFHTSWSCSAAIGELRPLNTIDPESQGRSAFIGPFKRALQLQIFKH